MLLRAGAPLMLVYTHHTPYTNISPQIRNTCRTAPLTIRITPHALPTPLLITTTGWRSPRAGV